MQIKKTNKMLEDYYNLLANYTEGKKIKKVLGLSETHVTLLMEDDVIIQFMLLEDEIIFDIKPPKK
ncbi:hypothetical protein [Thermosyntropha sp.]|uniref:hypothetical protein n=1 Tax=Thermosyntropha sp. TaxID=2740820 RepID=UPI0025DF5220|nr:hypothetical protein [Thermosyntropha sp.]MBO8159863.1 hypothetical protein [Thermosyntropha sp.]